jgi:hypothetical protein
LITFFPKFGSSHCRRSKKVRNSYRQCEVACLNKSQAVSGRARPENGIASTLFPGSNTEQLLPLRLCKESAPRIGVPNCGRAFGSGSWDFECDFNRNID